MAEHHDIEKPLTKTLTILSVIILIITCFGLVSGPRVDSYYMIAEGRWMLKHHEIVTTNIFAPTVTGTSSMPMQSQNWLWCILYALLANAGDAIGHTYLPIILFNAALDIILWLLVYKAALTYTDNKLLARLSQLFVFANNPYLISNRSTIFALIVALITFWYADEIADDAREALDGLLPLLLIAIHLNAQASLVVVDVAILFAVAIHAYLNHYPHPHRALIMALTSVIIALTCEPYGNLVRDILTNASTALASLPITELRPISENLMAVPNLVCAVSVACLAVTNSNRTKTFKSCPWVVAAILSAICACLKVRLIVYTTLFALILFWNLFDRFDIATKRNTLFVTGITAMLTMQLISGVGAVIQNTHQFVQNNAESEYLTTRASGDNICWYLSELAVVPDDNGSVLDATGRLGSYFSVQNHPTSLNSKFEVWDQPFGTSTSWLGDYMYMYNNQTKPEGAIALVDWDYVVAPISWADTEFVQYFDDLNSYGRVATTDHFIIWHRFGA